MIATPLGDFLASAGGVVIGTWLYHSWRDRSSPRSARVSETPNMDPREEDT